MSDPIIGEVYQKKLQRRAFSRAFYDAIKAWSIWHDAMLAEDTEKAQLQRAPLMCAMDEAMLASGMSIDPHHRGCHEADE